jgi:hypothetical protein
LRLGTAPLLGELRPRQPAPSIAGPMAVLVDADLTLVWVSYGQVVEALPIVEARYFRRVLARNDFFEGVWSARMASSDVAAYSATL